MGQLNYSDFEQLKPIRRLLFGLSGRSETLSMLTSGSPIYIAGAVKIPVEDLLEVLSNRSDCRCLYVETTLYSGVYVEFSDICVLIIQPNRARLTLGSECVNQSIESQLTEELLVFGGQHSINHFKDMHFGVLWSLVEVFAQTLCHVFNISKEQFHYIKLINTFTRIHQLYCQLDSGIPTEGTSYVEEFSWIYFLEIQCIRRYFAKDTLINLHDVATNSANFPILIQRLTIEKLLPFNLHSIVCSDYQPSPAINNVNSFQNAFNLKSSIHIDRLDLRMKNESLLSANVITANDVLEHFVEDESKAIFRNLWEHTQKLLIIHVPIETVPAKQYGHLTSFTNEKLFEWAKELPGCKNLTHSYLQGFRDKYAMSINGFLVLERV